MRGELALILVVLINSMGVLLMLQSGSGISAISSVPYALLCFGIALSNRCKLPIIPTDLFPRELAEITKVPYSRIKIGFDVTCLLVTGCMTYFCLGRILGLGIGTVLAAFTMGKGIAWVGGQIDKRFTFVSVLSERTEKAI